MVCRSPGRVPAGAPGHLLNLVSPSADPFLPLSLLHSLPSNKPRIPNPCLGSTSWGPQPVTAVSRTHCHHRKRALFDSRASVSRCAEGGQPGLDGFWAQTSHPSGRVLELRKTAPKFQPVSKDIFIFHMMLSAMLPHHNTAFVLQNPENCYQT